MESAAQKLSLYVGANYLLYKALDYKYNLAADLRLARRMYPLLRAIRKFANTQYNVSVAWERIVKRFANKKAIVMLEDDNSTRHFTFQDLDVFSTRVANFLSTVCKLNPGDTVALFMENRPEFVGLWLGMAKMGVKVAMINTAIVKNGLLHCIKISHAKMLIFGSELQAPIRDILHDLQQSGIALYSQHGPETDMCKSCDALIASMSTARNFPPSTDAFTGVFGYIYTSGTTGLPKAALITHQKVYSAGSATYLAFNMNPNDILYETLPLFHSAGGLLGIGTMINQGITVVLRKKFTASRFFQDCYQNECTVAQYIGELCRYLMQTPPSKFDRMHKLRLVFGNGLRPEIWQAFQDRFNIPEVGEFYGATESNGILVNHCTSKEAVGACGRVGALGRRITGLKFAKYDVSNDVHLRNQQGFCIPCELNEPGEMFQMIKPNDPATAFQGYEDKKATQKKIIHDAFEKGDQYFLTGDLLSIDAKGYIRFVDRIGDTFRWKGENCSTTEVGEVLSGFPGIEEPNVYGVLIPNNQDGRAPCAAITPKEGKLENIDLPSLAKYLKKNLPPFAVPLFLRIIPRMELTATLKQTKNVYRDEGINISKIPDQMFYLQGEKYVPLTKEIYSQLCTPGARL